MKKIIFYRCKNCGYEFEEESNNVYYEGKKKECPTCHTREVVVKFKRVTNIDEKH